MTLRPVIKLSMNLRRAWKDISVAKKLYVVVGVMGLLIAVELFTLRFAMNTLSSVRAFVGGEGLWSKAQKTATLSLQKYAQTSDPQHYREFLAAIEVPLGDRQARLEMMKPRPDFHKIREGFLRGRVHDGDIPGLVDLVLRFHRVPHLAKALAIWEEGDRQMSEFIAAAEKLHGLVIDRASATRIGRQMAVVERLNHDLTKLEDDFSYTLGEGSRWLESLLMTILVLAVLLVESTGLALTISFSRHLNKSLRELGEGAERVGQGDFSVRIPVRSKDEIGQLATALNSMTAQLEKSVGRRQVAERANESKSAFLANVSHEIRTPLGAIIGFADLMRDTHVTADERKQYAEIIHRTGTNLSKLINDLLDISKVEAGRLEIDKAPFSLHELLDEVRQLFELKCREKGIDLLFDCPRSLPDRIVSDPLRLRQILLNLLGNAVKFTETGYVKLSCELMARERKLRFVVEDTGPGIPQEQVGQLFRPYGQAANKRKHQGTGLGLVLSRDLARMLGGDVTLEASVVSRGTRFSATIAFEPAKNVVRFEPRPDGGSATL